MRKGKTESGFEFEINEKDLDDYRFMKMLADAQDDVLVFTKVVTRLLGADQEQRLCKHLEDENGRVPTETLVNTVTEIMTIAGEDVKNS